MTNREDDKEKRNRRRWPPPRWVVHIAAGWFIVGSILSLLEETAVGPWWRVAYEALVGGNGLGLIVYVNGGAYLAAEEIHMIISHLNNIRDREEAEAKARREREEAVAKARREREEAVTKARREGQAQGEAEGEARGQAEGQARVEGRIEAVRETLTPEELDGLPPAVRELLNRRYDGSEGNGTNGR